MKPAFEFSTGLDSSVINTFYLGDLQHTHMMFELCLEQLPMSLGMLKTELSQGTLDGCTKVLHKLKPTFTMVGNDPLSQHIGSIHKQMLSGTLLAHFKEDILDIISEIEKTILLLEHETTNLKTYLNL